MSGTSRAAWSAWLPGGVVEILDPERHGDRLATLGYPAEGVPRAYVCVGEKCLAPATTVEDLEDRLAR